MPPGDAYQISYVPSLQDLRTLNRVHLWNSSRSLHFLAVIPVVVLPLWLVIAPEQEPLSPKAFIVLFLPALLLGIYLYASHQVKRLWNRDIRLREPRAYTLHDDAIEVSSPSFSIRAPWENVTLVTRKKDLFIVRVSTVEYLAFRESHPKKAQALWTYIKSKVPPKIIK